MSPPLVSVVLPTYDRAPVLGDAIDSVLAQTYERLELVVVDGGSTDGTTDLVESYDDQRVRYLRRDEPAGVSAARNAGVREARGDLLAFVDSDDRWTPEKLRVQVAELKRAGPTCAVCYSDLTMEQGEPSTRDGASGRIYDDLLSMAVPTYTSTLVVTREAFVRAGGFDESLGCFEDWELCLRLGRRYAFRYVDAPLVRKGSAGDNVSADPDRLADAVSRLERVYDLPDETLARLFADAGVTYCEAGDLESGRPYLRAALRHDRRQANAAVALLLASFGSPALFDRGMDGFFAGKRLAARLPGG